jgi:hypothetical protein
MRARERAWRDLSCRSIYEKQKVQHNTPENG